MVGLAAIAELFGGNAGTEELEAFYPIRPDCLADIPKTRFRPRVGKTLSARRWHAAFSEDGHLDIEKVLRRIQRGGIHPSIKGPVWEFLLGCFDPNSTFDDRNQLREQRRERYAMWKTECQNMVPVIGSGKYITRPIITDDGQPIEGEDCHVTSTVSDKKVAHWMLFLHQIGLDVFRTDRALVFYEDEANQAKLWDILAIYSWVDDDIGYVQGMNDICSPMVILLENEADAFWCFEHAMRRLRENFRCSTSSIGVQSQLSILSQVIKTVDPKLHQHLEDLDGGEYLFAFRMLMVLFRREFSFVDALYLWEVMWAMEYNPNIFSLYEQPDAALDSNSTQTLHAKELKRYGKFQRKNLQNGHMDKNCALSVFLVASVLETKNRQILKDAKGLDDVVTILGEITGNLDAKKACQNALKIQDKYLKKAKKS
ncbi:TBC1 domain family member 15 [Gossypium australe]|uniref:TBC1 domain family member 15 n=1 Tax=Gossypium australe TaxID=47621 RepID=A0A5B6UP67_9ROSI|nr:TBC1 domain family member 15 [Gossypium australe]